MNLPQRVMVWAGSGLLLLTLVGLFVRARHRRCYSFTFYLGAVLVPQLLYVVWPDRFYTHTFWIAQEVIHSTLKFALVLELGYRILREFPGALAAGRRLALAVTGGVYAIVVAVPGGYQADFAALLSRALNGTIWLFVALAALVVWYRLPVDPLHKAILVGFIPYLLAFSVGMAAIETFGWDIGLRIAYVHTLAYLVLEAYWAYAAWRPEGPRVLPSPR